MQVRKSITLLTAIAMMGAATASWSQESGRNPQIPIVIKPDPPFDACGAKGVVNGLDPSGDGFLVVRDGPGTKYAEIGRLINGQEVYLCNEKGEWLGVVYSKQKQNCEVSTQRFSTQRYAGPCNSGWVHRNWVRLTAG